MKIGKWDVSEFVKGWAWTRNRIIAASVGGAVVLVGLGVMIGRSGGPPPEPVEEVPPYPAQAQLTADLKKQADFLSRGAMMSIFFHETGHMLITELNLPAVGPEEDVVDEFATFFLTDLEKAAPDKLKPLYANVVVAGALFWKLSAEQSDIRKYPFYDEHSPDAKRFFNILCIATGADPLRFIPMAVKNGVPENRLVSCAGEYQKKHAAWERLIEPHTKSWFGRTFHTGGRMTLQIGPVGKAEWLPFELTWRQGGFFQQMLDGLSDTFDLPEDIPVIVKTCNGTVNAFWSPDEKTITVCHEMFDAVNTLFSNAMAAAQQQQAIRQGGADVEDNSQPVTGGVPQPQQGGGTTMAFLVGRWVCNVVDPRSGMQGMTDTLLSPDGKFTTRSQVQTGLTSSGWGRWSVPASNTIRYDFEGVSPPQFCGPGGCVPNVVQSPDFVMYRITGPASIAIRNATCRKT